MPMWLRLASQSHSAPWRVREYIHGVGGPFLSYTGTILIIAMYVHVYMYETYTTLIHRYTFRTGAHTTLYTCISLNAYTNIQHDIQVYASNDTSVWECNVVICICICSYMYIHACIYRHTHMYTAYNHIHMHIHAYTDMYNVYFEGLWTGT
jgi:hypothetical protein